MKTPTPISMLRTKLAARRAARRHDRLLWQELSSYTSPSERPELQASLSRHTRQESRLEAMLTRTALSESAYR
jgi:hypothetical protein